MLAVYLADKCKALILENSNLLMQKLSTPDSWISYDISGSLVEAAENGMGGLASFAGDYLTKNADALFMSALKASGYEQTFMDAYNLAMNMIASALMARNDLVFRMMKEVAWGCMRELAAKDKILIQLVEDLKEMHLLLASLVGADPEWDIYYKVLRDALNLVVASRRDLSLTRNTLMRNDFWLTRKYDASITQLEKAKDLITPKENNPAISSIVSGSHKIKSALKTSAPDKTKPRKDTAAQAIEKTRLINEGFTKIGHGLAYFGDGLVENFPIPTSEQKWQAAVAIGNLSKRVLDDLQGYSEATFKVNFLVLSFITGLDSLSAELPAFFKKYILSLIDSNLERIDTLIGGMALTINGSETAIKAPVKGYRPNNLAVSVQGFKWIMDINLILNAMKLIPAKQLSALNLNGSALGKYKAIVAQLLKMDDLKSGMAILRMTDGQENPADLQTQVLAFLLEANNSIMSRTVRKSILQLSRTILSRLELSLIRDDQIYNLMQAWWFTELPIQDTLNQVYNGIVKMLGDAGLDRMQEQFINGDFSKMFNLKGRDGAYVGAALAAVSALKKCFKSGPARDKLAGVEADLNADADLLNISFSINFDLAILKNLQGCLDLNALADFFKIKQNLCGILTDSIKDSPKMSALFTKMSNVFSSWGGT